MGGEGEDHSRAETLRARMTLISATILRGTRWGKYQGKGSARRVVLSVNFRPREGGGNRLKGECRSKSPVMVAQPEAR